CCGGRAEHRGRFNFRSRIEHPAPIPERSQIRETHEPCPPASPAPEALVAVRQVLHVLLVRHLLPLARRITFHVSRFTFHAFPTVNKQQTHKHIQQNERKYHSWNPEHSSGRR